VGVSERLGAAGVARGAGLDRYGFHTEATEVRRRWCNACAHGFTMLGTMLRSTTWWNRPRTGTRVYGLVEGFGWTNGVFVDFAASSLKVRSEVRGLVLTLKGSDSVAQGNALGQQAMDLAA